MPPRNARGRRARNLTRPRPAREPYDRVLIVSEGIKTEPLYLREVVDVLKLSSANISITGANGSAPITVVNHAINLFEQESARGGQYDRVYCVLDQDSHASYSAALQKLKSIRPRDLFYAISSVPCFEYWVLLHFEYTTQAFVRTGKQTPCESVITRVKKHLPEYSKGTGKLYDIIGDNTDVAIKRAEQANRDGARAGTDNPSTDVGSLIQYLRKIKA